MTLNKMSYPQVLSNRFLSRVTQYFELMLIFAFPVFMEQLHKKPHPLLTHSPVSTRHLRNNHLDTFVAETGIALT